MAILRAFLDANGDNPPRGGPPRASHTLRCRFTRLQETVGLDLTDADERLVAHLQLRLVDE